MAKTQYVGMAGHLAVMSEFSLRGYNVAIPEIDLGDDVFVVNDVTGALWRVQVKTANARVQKKSRRYQFRVRQSAIDTAQYPELHFVFVMRDDAQWRFLVLDRAVLKNYVVAQSLGSAANQFRPLTVTLHNDGRAVGSKIDLSHHLEAWNTWPELG